jgi:hypothetical protein
MAMKIKVRNHELVHIADITPLLDEDGYPVESYLTDDEDERDKTDNTYAKSKFCTFRIALPARVAMSGVFAIYVDREISYIDACDNLKQRINTRYGSINRHMWIKQTYSRFANVNMNILREYKRGNRIGLYFLETDDCESVMRDFADEVKPKWNMKPSRNIDGDAGAIRKSEFKDINKLKKVSQNGLSDENFRRLQDHLASEEGDTVELTFAQIESIVGGELPPTAYSFRTWWQYGSNSHKSYWRNAGFKVRKVKLGEMCIFERV